MAAALRVYALELKPMHHDEGVNGFFLTNLLRQGAYRYDPTNYHGPTLYYLTLPLAYVADKLGFLSTWALRLVTAIFGVGIVWLVLSLRRHTGALAALVAAALVAVSPGCVFYSRYFIHEIPFVFFTLGLVVAALRFYETGASRYLLFAAASAAMLFATKETAFISVGTLGLAWLVAWGWVKWQGDARAKKRGGAGFEKGFEKLFTSGQAATALGFALALFVLVWVLFYSSFLTNMQGVADSFKAFAVWKRTGMSDFHEKPFSTYVTWLIQEEAPILVLSVIGSCIALFERRKNRFAIFAGAWGFGLLVAYSLIKYKTPWLMLSFIVPLAIVGGYAVQSLARLVPFGEKGLSLALIVAGLALSVGMYQTVVLNFSEYDNDSYIYVYSHTRRQFLDMIKEMERAASVAGDRKPGIAVASREYWPLPWYLRDNPHAGYPNSIAPSYDPQSTLMVIGRKSDTPKDDDYAKLRQLLGANYVEAGVYALRPGVDLVLFERRDLAAKR